MVRGQTPGRELDNRVGNEAEKRQDLPLVLETWVARRETPRGCRHYSMARSRASAVVSLRLEGRFGPTSSRRVAGPVQRSCKACAIIS